MREVGLGRSIHVRDVGEIQPVTSILPRSARGG